MSCTKRIDESSGCALSSALNLFAVPPTNVAVSKSYFREILPLNTITESPYHFRLFSDNLWADLSRVYIYWELGLEREDAATRKWIPIDDTDVKLAPNQGIAQTLIRQLKLTVSNTEVYDSGTLFPFKAYFTNELSFPLSVKKTFLASRGYYLTNKHDADTDAGFVSRTALFSEGKKAQFLARLDFDLGNQELFMLNNTDILFTVYRASDDFVLQSLNTTTAPLPNYRLTVHSVKLYVKMVEVQPSLNLSIYARLEKQTAKYAMRRTEIKSCYLTEGRTEFEHNIFNHVIPRRVTFGLVKSKAFNGDRTLSPFNFQPFDLRDLSVHAGGQQFPSVAYNNLQFTTGACMRPYVDLYEALGLANSDRTCGITFEQFRDGWTFLVVPLTSTLDDNCGFELVKNGSTNVRLTFNSPIPAGGVELVILAEFDQIISIDFNRRIITDIISSS